MSELDPRDPGVSLPSTTAPDAREIVSGRAEPRGPRDPGTPGRARLAGWLVFALIGAVFLVQQTVESAASRATKWTEASAIHPPGAQVDLATRMYVRVFHAVPMMQKKDSLDSLQESLRQSTAPPVADVRMAILHGEIDRTLISDKSQQGVRARHEIEQVLNRLDTMSELPPSDASTLRRDAESLRRLYAGHGLIAESAESLRAHHGYIGELAAVFDAPDGDAKRQELTGRGTELISIFAGGLLIAGGCLVAGFVLLITFLVKRGGGTWHDHFVPPERGGSIPIETVLIFVLGFLLLKGAGTVAEGAVGARGAMFIALGCQWLLLLVLLYPCARGMRFAEGMRMLGIHKGKGILREIGCGVVGYLACLPIMFGAILLTLCLVLIQGLVRHALQRPEQKVENPIIELASGSTVLIVIFYLLASIWAPIVEETVFRGALFRHLRSKWSLLPSAIVTGVAFGVMHGYSALMLAPVISIGFGFSFMRQWRDSIIAAMTAHFLHNTAVLALLLVVLRLV